MSFFNLIFGSQYSSSVAKGVMGEISVKNSLINQKDYYSFHDITIGTQQIDHVLVCPKGVFTIETKNYQGTIYGSHVKSEWSQVFKCMGKYNVYYKKNTFYNPVMQAENHSKALYYHFKKAYGMMLQIKTIVVFKESATLKVFSPKTPVVYHKDLMSKIASMPTILSISACKEIARLLQSVAQDQINKHKTTYQYSIQVN